MAIDLLRLSIIVAEESANFPYIISDGRSSQVVGYLHKKRNKKVSVMTDIERALAHFKIPLHFYAGYRRAIGRYFNQTKKLDRFGRLITGPRKKRGG